MTPLYQDRHLVVVFDRGQRLVRVMRTPEPFADLAEVATSYGEVASVMEAMRDRPRLAILVDLRAAPSRNDPQFENTVAPFRRRMYREFARVALLVKSAAGRLNVARHAREDHVVACVFTDEQQALAYVTRG
jgi:hypothetical protein